MKERIKQRLCRLGLGGMLLFLITGAMSSAGAAGLEHQFKPGLSLTGGDCSIAEPLDPEPDPGCADAPPPSTFSSPTAVTVDIKGNIYVASYGGGANGRIDIFDSSGFFLAEVPDASGPLNMAVDSAGVLYVANGGEPRLTKYVPTVYGPAVDDIAYGNPPQTLIQSAITNSIGLAINRANDHLFADRGGRIQEWKSHAEGGDALPDPVPPGTELLSTHGSAFAIDAVRGRMYAREESPSFGPPLIDVLELDPPHALLQTIDGSTVPGGEFSSFFLTAAVDEGTGHLFVYDGDQSRLLELTQTGDFVGVLEHGFQVNGAMQPAVDNGPESPNGALNPDGRYLYVPSHPTNVGHSFAFGPSDECEPIVKEAGFANVGEEEAELRATVNPCNLPTTYTFEYTTEKSFELEGFDSAVAARSGQLPPTQQDEEVRAGAFSLAPDTAYRFRVIATNSLGSSQGEERFRTYPASSVESCPNDPLRTGLSAGLPDCRAYELITGADTNGRAPLGLGESVASVGTSPSGEKVSFRIEGGSLPDREATGALEGDAYLAIRDGSGWKVSYTGPSGGESVSNAPKGTSPDQEFLYWHTGTGGSAPVGGKETSYLRYPDGNSELIGRGSEGTDPYARGDLIGPDGDHIIFQSGGIGASVPKKLEPNAPPDGTVAIYDRTADEKTHVVSLLPGDITPSAGKSATFQGASLEGKGVAFSIGSKLYLRYDNAETFEIGDGVAFAGVADGGNRIFYLEGGKLLRFDALTELKTIFNSNGAVTPVNVSADGTAAYFISTSVLTGEANPNGANAIAGQQNLYLSEEGTISFVGTVTSKDVDGASNGAEVVGGLGLWVRAVGPVGGLPGRYAIDPSRSTSDGSVLLFESRAELTDDDPDGHVQVHRYDVTADSLDCLSCNPTGAPSSGEAGLQSIRNERGQPVPLSIFSPVMNLSNDGNRAFFQSTEPLVADDNDGLQDVYQWENQGVGTCERSGG